MKIFCGIENMDRFDFGTFYIESGNTFFPCEKWTDFHLPIINYWISELIANNNIACCKFTIYFMDGPYYLLCEKKDDMAFVIGKKEDLSEHIFFEKMLYSDLKKIVYNAAEAFLKKKGGEKEVKDKELNHLYDEMKLLRDIL